MGSCTSQSIRVAPVTADVSNKPITAYHNGTDSLEASTGDHKSTSSSATTQRGYSRPPSTSRVVRPSSRLSRKSGRMGGGMYQGMGRIGGRPRSKTDSLNHSGNNDKLRDTFGRKKPPAFSTSSGLLNQSQSSAIRQISFLDVNPCESSSSEELSTVVLRPADNEDGNLSATKCPCCLSQFGRIVHIPYLLLCGHSYCSSCINIALKNDPSFLKCGLCSISTSVQPQCESNDLIKNEPVIELTENKEYQTILDNSVFDRCAECDNEIASVYCSDCSASFCNECNMQQHTGSRVRSKHKPVSISLKPRPQPTCKKHPGQSCVLYCETERQPMCVLCKFYGHHKFHNYQLLNNSSSAYRKSLEQKLAQLEKVEVSLSKVAQNLTNSRQEIKKRAMESQDKLERSFEEAREELIAALEQREATLLVLLDKQVQKREEIAQDEQEEAAFARARTIAAIEEAKRLLELNPVSALLARKHMDSVIDTVLKQTVSYPSDTSVGEEEYCTQQNVISSQLLPIGLKPKQELSKRMSHVLEQHGAILQLPEQPTISYVKVMKDCIMIQWKLFEENNEVASDRTLSYCLQCFADVPFKFKKNKLFDFNKRFQNINRQPSSGFTPDSGYQDEASERSSQTSDNKTGPCLPSLPPSLRNTNNVSLVALQESTNTRIAAIQDDKTVPGKATPISIHGLPNLKDNQSARASGALLNLPPLLPKREKTEDTTLSNSDFVSSSNMSGELADNEDTPRPKGTTATIESDSLSSSTSSLNTTAHLSLTTENTTSDVGRYCKGYAFEEIYSGRDTSFRYSGIIKGATYYFRLQCHNAAGHGPWSNTYKCTVQPLTN